MERHDWDDSALVDAYDRAVDAYKEQRRTQRQPPKTDEHNHRHTQHHAHTNTHGHRRRQYHNLEHVEYKSDTEDRDNTTRTRATTTGHRAEHIAPHSAPHAYADTCAPPLWAESAPAYGGSGSSYAAPSSSSPPPPYAQLPRAGAAVADVGGAQLPGVPGVPMPGAWPPGVTGPSVPNVAASGGGTEDDDLANLMLAWYHCGFFTARYQERRSRPS